MRRTLAVLISAIALAALTGCNRNCDECDDRAECPCQRCDHSAITHCFENVPAPAPMALEAPRAVPPVVVKPFETKPIAEAPKPVVPAKPIARVIEVRQAPTPPQPRPRKLRSGENELNDL